MRKNKKFNALMKKYVSFTASDKEKDLNGVNYEKTESEQGFKLQSAPPKFRYARISFACALVVAIVLGIALPLTLKNLSPKNPSSSLTPQNPSDIDNLGTQLEPSEDFFKLEVESLKYVTNNYGMDIKLQKYKKDRIKPCIIMRGDETVFGFYMYTFILDDVFDDIKITALKSGTEQDFFPSLTDYEYYMWNNTDVWYKITYDSLYGCYNAELCFAYDGYKYLVQSSYYEEFTIEEFLDVVY